MDDLAGLSWAKGQKPTGAASAGLAGVRSGSATPNYSPLRSMGANPAQSPSTQSRSGSSLSRTQPKDDPFGELVSFSSSASVSAQQSQAKLSLRERQQLLEEQARSSRSNSPFSFEQTAAPGASSSVSPASMFPGASGRDTWNFDALESMGAPPKPPRQQSARPSPQATRADAMAFDPLATLPPPATGPNGGLPMRGLGGSPAPAPAPAPAHIASISDDEPIPMDSYPAAATQPEPFVDKDFEIAQVADYGFTVDQARAALEITGSPRAAIQLLREQKAATRQAPGGQSAVENRSNTGKSRLRTPYNDEPRRRYSSSSGDDDGGDGHYYDNPRRNDSSNSRGAQRAGNGADSLLASANEIGASVWKQANSWFETGKKKFMEMQETVTEQHWPVARADGGWSRPGRDAEYMSASSQRRRNYDTSSDDDDDHYVPANRRGRPPGGRAEPAAQEGPRLYTASSFSSGRPSRPADAVDPVGGMGGVASATRAAPAPQPRAPSERPQGAAPGGRPVDMPQPARKSPVEAAVPSVPGHLLAMCNTAKADANEKFKLGQFGDAIAGYTQAIAQVSQHSAQHPLLILLYNNRALAYTRNGEARMALTDCSQALQLCTAYQANGTIDLGDVGCVDVADQRAKALQRRAEAHEADERYQEALSDWKELREAARDGNARQQSTRGIQRCERALGIGQPAPKAAPRAAAVATPEDIASVFASISLAKVKGGGTNILNQQTESSAAVAEMRRKEQAKQVEDDQRLAIVDQVDAELARWKAGKEQNLRALLSSVHMLLPAFPPIGMHEVIEAAKVKRVYMRTIAKLHPDKLSKETDIRTKMVSASVFSSLNEAWDAFKAQERTS